KPASSQKKGSRSRGAWSRKIATKISGKMRANDSCGSRLVCDVINCSASHRKMPALDPWGLIDLPLLRGNGGIKLDFPEGAFVLAHILLQNCQQSFGLLRAEIDPLKVLHFHILCVQRLQAAKHQQKVPNAYADLN